MTLARKDSAAWQQRLDELIAEHNVPGAALAVSTSGTTHVAASGSANLVAGIETTPDTLFQIGSITKVYTAALAMRLVDSGDLDLDAPIVQYVPDFRVADEDVTARVTMRQLLSHTSGFGGDLF